MARRSRVLSAASAKTPRVHWLNRVDPLHGLALAESNQHTPPAKVFLSRVRQTMKELS